MHGGATIANDTSTCTSNEYGNPMTVMGGGCRHLISVEKWYSGFFQGCNAVKVKTSGTFTLLPIEIPCNGIQALQIPLPAGAPKRTTTTVAVERQRHHQATTTSSCAAARAWTPG